jgi:hypothetical protein
MPTYASDFHGERHRFGDLKDVLAKAFPMADLG